MRRCTSISYLTPPERWRELDPVAGIVSQGRFHRIGEPLEKFPDLQALEFDRIPDRDLLQDFISDLWTPITKKAEDLALSPSRTMAAALCHSSVGAHVHEQKDPGPVKGDAVCPVLFFPCLDEIDAFPDRFTNWGVAVCHQLGVKETVSGIELQYEPGRAKRHEGDLDALDRERVVMQFIIEFADTGIELGDGLARNGSRSTEQ